MSQITPLKIEMLSTGDEVLYGQIVDTNAAWLADTMFQHGYPLHYRSTVGDDLEALIAVLQARSQQADVVIVNGGLGPTSDDLSAEAAAAAAGVPLVEHADWLAHIEQRFARQGRPMAAVNRKQAWLPQGATLIDNPIGTACGFLLTLNRCHFFFTPGVPSEFRLMVEQQILPWLQKHHPLPTAWQCLRMTTLGRSESDLAQALQSVALPPQMTLGYRSAMPIIEIKLTGPVEDPQAVNVCWQAVRECVGESWLYDGTEAPETAIAALLRQQQRTLRLVEHFSAGGLFQTLQRAGAPLTDSLLAVTTPDTLPVLAQQARAAAEETGALTLIVGQDDAQQLTLTLADGQTVLAQRLRLRAAQHSVALRQQIAVLVALKLLLNWLTEARPLASIGWLEVVETYRE